MPFNDLTYVGDGDAVVRPPLPAADISGADADAYEAATPGCITNAVANGVYEEELS